MTNTVRQLRLVVTADDYDEALRFYRDVLGLPEGAASHGRGRPGHHPRRGPGHARDPDPRQAEYIDRVEVGRRVAGHLRVALEVVDCPAATGAAVDAGATLVAAPTVTPWNSLNARLDAPGSLHLTLFAEQG